jgi:hypothetical protein
MSKAYGLGFGVGVGAGVGLYFLVVYLLPTLGKMSWIWT